MYAKSVELSHKPVSTWATLKSASPSSWWNKRNECAGTAPQWRHRNIHSDNVQWIGRGPSPWKPTRRSINLEICTYLPRIRCGKPFFGFNLIIPKPFPTVKHELYRLNMPTAVIGKWILANFVILGSWIRIPFATRLYFHVLSVFSCAGWGFVIGRSLIRIRLCI